MTRILALFFGLIAVPVVATPTVIAVSDTGFIVENNAVINATAKDVWRALIHDVNNWWPKDHSWWGVQGTLSIEPRANGCFCEVAGERSARHMQIVFVEPGKLLRMTGGLGPLQGMGVSGALDWQLNEQAGQTYLTLTYKVNGFYPAGFKELAPIVAEVQGLQLQGLVNYLNND